MNWVKMLVGVALVAGGGASLYLTTHGYGIGGYLLIGGGLGAVAALLNELSASANRTRDAATLDAAQANVAAEPEKAKPAWDLARATLDVYFHRNLSQIRLIFWLSVGVMIAGFCVILWGVQQGVALATTGEKLDSLKALPAIVAGFSGVLTEFIGATFLFIFKSTMQQASDFSKTLERINSVGMAMQILDTMPDSATKDDLKSATKAQLVELLVKSADTK